VQTNHYNGGAAIHYHHNFYADTVVACTDNDCPDVHHIGRRYDLTRDQLVDIIDAARDHGFDHGPDVPPDYVNDILNAALNAGVRGQ
jgi:hypothetical protein